MRMSRAKRIVICGGGAIGVAIAYFLSRRGAAPIVIERHQVAGSASGKSGGFLALDWCRGSPLDRLARRSFTLHAELADDARQSLGLSAPRHLWRPRYRGWRPRSRRAAVAVRRRDDHGPARLAADDGDRRAARLHHGPDGRGREARRRAAARHGRRPGARQERRRTRRRARRRRDRRRRRRGHRHGAVVDPGDALAAAARCLRLQGPQPDLPDR